MNASLRSEPGRVHRTIELLANLAIVVVAALGSVVLVRQLGTAPAPQSSASPISARPMASIRPAAPSVGSTLSVPDVDFAAADRTLVMVLSTQCGFCTDSAPFYRRLAAAGHGRTRLVAVFPQDLVVAREFLAGLGVSVAGVVRAPVSAVGVRGTPTLVLVDQRGVVQKSWIGRLTPDGEAEVFNAVTATATRGTS